MARLQDPDALIHIHDTWDTCDEQGKPLIGVHFFLSEGEEPTRCPNHDKHLEQEQAEIAYALKLAQRIATIEGTEVPREASRPEVPPLEPNEDGWPSCPYPGCGWHYLPGEIKEVVFVRPSVWRRKALLRQAIKERGTIARSAADEMPLRRAIPIA